MVAVNLRGLHRAMVDVVSQAGHDPLELDGMIRGGPHAYDDVEHSRSGEGCFRPSSIPSDRRSGSVRG